MFLHWCLGEGVGSTCGVTLFFLDQDLFIYLNKSMSFGLRFCPSLKRFVCFNFDPLNCRAKFLFFRLSHSTMKYLQKCGGVLTLVTQRVWTNKQLNNINREKWEVLTRVNVGGPSSGFHTVLLTQALFWPPDDKTSPSFMRPNGFQGEGAEAARNTKNKHKIQEVVLSFVVSEACWCRLHLDSSVVLQSTTLTQIKVQPYQRIFT